MFGTSTQVMFAKNVKTKPINTVDIYQLMCHVLGITPSANDGIWSHDDDILADTSP
jgi:hypothetical protein